MKWILRIVGLLAVAVAGLLAYGYWYASSHGALSIFVDDVSDAQRTHPIVPVELSFLDGSGAVLATAAGTNPSGGIFLTSPPEYACHAVEERASFDTAAREAWQRCFDSAVTLGAHVDSPGDVGRRPYGAMLAAARAAVVRRIPRRLVALVGPAASRRRQAPHAVQRVPPDRRRGLSTPGMSRPPHPLKPPSRVSRRRAVRRAREALRQAMEELRD